MTDYRLVKVIDRRSVFGDKKEVLKLVMSDEEGTHFLYRVFGSCTGIVKGAKMRKNATTGEEEAQEWRKLTGEFFAQNASGAGYESGQCFLPRDVTDVVAAQFEQGVLSVEFAYDIFAAYNANSATSYVFLARPVMSADDSAAKKMKETLPALPAASNVKKLAAPKKTADAKPD